MEALSRRIRQMEESQTIKMAQLSREMKQNGVDIIDLSLGEPDFTTPDYIKQGGKDAIDQGYTHYPPVAGYAELKEAISNKFKRENGLDYRPDQIVVSTGAKQSLANIMLSMVDPGDEVIVQAPYWVSYKAQIQLAEGTMVIIPTTIEADFKITPRQLEEQITDKTKLFLFSSPCNPTGSVYSMEELEQLAEVFERNPQVYVISDEIYEFINFREKHESIAAFPAIKERVIIVNGFSKGFAMTGWRLGYMAAPPPVAKACTKMQGQFTSGASTISQRAALAAITGDLSPTHAMREAFKRRRDLFISLLEDIPGFNLNKPEGAFYLFPEISSYFVKNCPDGSAIRDADDLCMYLLREGHVSLVTGSAFGNEKCIRLSYANSEGNLEKAADRIKNTLAKLT